MTIQEATGKICAFRDERDWLQFHNPKDLATAISIEASELLEHFLWKTPEQVDRHVVEKNEAVREEIADIAIYIFELAHNLNIDLNQAIEEKLAKNAVKYPVAKAKGSIKKYTEL
jgi:NTP pyrophosphatase (non-canonical NTP hydrolase)